MGTTVEERPRKVRTTITLPRDLYSRIRRAMGVSKRNLSAEIEYGMERYIEQVERDNGLVDVQKQDEPAE